LDRNADGQINVRELSQFLEEESDFSFYEILNKVSTYFQAIDADFDGTITFEGFRFKYIEQI